YEISFRAKWLSGSNQFHSRLYFNRAARTTLLDVPDGGGTPGVENSRRVANAGPSFSNLSHTPVVPAAGEAVVVTVDAGDPDSISGMAVNYSVNGAAFASTAMSDQGGGRWLGTIPGQAGASKIQFYLEATDGGGASSVFPAAGPESAAIIPVEDGQAILDYGDCQPNNLRIVMTDADRDALHTVTNVMSNDRLGCTVIWNESEIYYNCGVRLKGSQRGRAKDVRVGFNLRFPADRLFLGAHKTVAVDRSGAGDQFSQKEIMVKHAINHAGGGIPGMEDDLIRVIAPKSQHTSSAMLLKSRYDSEWLEDMYQDGGDGTAWEYELIYYPTSTTGGVEGLKRPNPDSVRGVGVGNLGSDPELYRWHWQIKNNRDADGYASLIEMLQAYGQGSSAQYHEDMRRLLDVDQWLRAFAVQKLFGIGDNYSSGSQHNAIFYQLPDGGKFLYFPWDMDFTFSAGATSSITGPGDLNKLLSDPANERAYYGHIVDIIDTTYNTGYMTPWANHYSCFLPTENLAGFLSYINTRSNSALSQVRNAIPQIPFEVTTGDSDTGGSTFTVQGNGWVDVDEIRLAGTPGNLPITWIDNNTWRVTVPVAPGTNIYTIEGYDQQGNLIDTDSLTLTGTGSVIPAAAGSLVISEIMYSPSAAEGEDADDFEFIELLNTHPSAPLDLTGIAFTDGIDFLFPAITLAPGERVVVPRKQAAFQSRYGLGVNVTAQYAAADDSNKLSNGGERLVLEDAVGFEIVSFTYNDKSPWPTAADGEGYSLVLCNPASAGTDPALPVSWRSSRSAGGSPGGFESDLVSDWAAGLGIVDLALDPDADGLSHVAEFFFNTDPFSTDSPVAVVESVGGAAVMRVVARNGAEGVEFSGSRSDDLNTWSPANYSGRLNNGDGITSTLIFTGTGLEALREFLRVEISELP
ncbi:MAG: lamin tail domain-containing protein, partial [Verrucomicrobiales bacterium]